VVIIVVVYVGAVKIYVASVEALRKKGKTVSKHVETQFGTKSGAFLSLTPSLKA
jgi:carbon starvation protein CstA